MSPIPTGKAVLVEGHLLQCGGACPVSLPQLQTGAVVLEVSAVYPPLHPSHRLALRHLAWPCPPCRQTLLTEQEDAARAVLCLCADWVLWSLGGRMEAELQDMPPHQTLL